MKASWGTIRGDYRYFGREIEAWGVNLYSTLSGNLIDGSFYQTYFSFPSFSEPGIYETFTCTTQYLGNNEASD